MRKNKPKPVVLIILDGWGINRPYTGNAITQADTPIIDQLITEYPSMTLRASGEAVGLPWGENGNSEVGHMNMGLGRIVYQELPRINKNISDNTFYDNEVLLGAIKHARKNNSKLHLMGVVSNGCVHASVDHLYALLLLAKEQNFNEVFIHAILDGRDVSYNSGVNFIKGVERSITEYGVGDIASISGRFYAMDRNSNWDRTEKAYLALTEGIGNASEDPIAALTESYDRQVYDEEFVPTFIVKDGKPLAQISDNDAVVFYNFRPDRARQITKAFVVDDFDGFKRKRKLKNLYFSCFREYEKNLPVEVVFPSEQLRNSIGEVVARNKLKQLRISETEKYAHVTYFFNGGEEDKMEGEDHILVPSPSVASYDKKPKMSASTVTDRLIEAINDDKYDLIIVNFPNADMVGHTGNISAAVKGIEFLDLCVGKIVDSVLAKDGVAMITADHGNADVMFNMQTGQIDKEHTSNPVPFIVVGNEYRGRNFGWQDVASEDLSLLQPQGVLSDIAPTILKVMDLDKPSDMTGVSLL